MTWEDQAYTGEYAKYRSIPWLYEIPNTPLMPWRVVCVNPLGYIVFISSGGTIFKMLRNPIVIVGDVIV